MIRPSFSTLGWLCADLIEAETAHETSVLVATVQVQPWMPHAVDRDHTASRAKDDIAVGQVTTLDICKAEARCDVPDPAG